MINNKEYEQLKHNLKTRGNPDVLRATCSRLLNNFSDKFYDWWDPKICGKYLDFISLLRGVPSYFDIWFPYLDKNNLIDWKLGGSYFTFFCHFKGLKDRQKVDIARSILRRHAYDLYFLVWKFIGSENLPDDWKLKSKGLYTKSLLICCPIINREDFEKIWNPDLFIWSRTSGLIDSYSKYIDIWWDDDKVRKNVSTLKSLIFYGKKYVDIWFPSFLKYARSVVEDYILKEEDCFRFFRFLRITRKYFDQYRYMFKKRKYYSNSILHTILNECQEVLVDIWDSVKYTSVNLSIITKIDPKILEQIKALELLSDDDEE